MKRSPNAGGTIANSASGLRHVFVRDLELEAAIGVWRHEHGRRQRIRVNLDLAVVEDGMHASDELRDVVCYQTVVDATKEIVGREHVKLAETLAERIAEACLIDRRVRLARVRVEKLDAVPGAASVGVEIERSQNSAEN
ncbi:MAG TPA: dihydroneopterin aldolase [Candidatus Cybelea sp.]|nr:dihydroneopterin aldolase [Candidatus Cybelea sp.]